MKGREILQFIQDIAATEDQSSRMLELLDHGLADMISFTYIMIFSSADLYSQKSLCDYFASVCVCLL